MPAYFIKPVTNLEYNSFYFKFHFSKVKNKADFTPGAFKIIDSLGIILFCYATFFGFDFNNYFVKYYKICKKLMRKNSSFIFDQVLLFLL